MCTRDWQSYDASTCDRSTRGVRCNNTPIEVDKAVLCHRRKI